MRILVTGASGFAGSLLVPRLLADGHHIRALGRDPRACTRHSPAGHREAAACSRSSAATRSPARASSRALEGVEVAYYLIHSMERRVGHLPAVPPSASGSRPRPSPRPPRARACGGSSTSAACSRAGRRRPRRARQPRRAGASRRSRHLASREAVERILLEAVPDSVALRASIVIGARSRSFRLLVHLVERMPVLTLPAWRRFRTQPIDARDMTEMLAAAPPRGRSQGARWTWADPTCSPTAR